MKKLKTIKLFLFSLFAIAALAGCDLQKKPEKKIGPAQDEINAMFVKLYKKNMGNIKKVPPVANSFTQEINGETWYVYDMEGRVNGGSPELVKLLYGVNSKDGTMKLSVRFKMVKRGNLWEGKWVSDKFTE